ncbi:MAG: T9SS type A sorting domain-containing protein [Bacteroidetes bacterium]|nr:T9SS type A sorting domain-containing protein [Bacteroidota bacterium]
MFSQPPSKFYTRFGGGGYDYGYDVKQTLDRGYIITGSTSSMGQGNTDAYLVKLDSMGTRKWQSAFGSFNNETARSVTQLADSSYVIAGYTNSTGFGGYDFYMVAADKNGNQLWEKTYGGSDWDFGYSMKPTSDGGFILCGTTYSYGRGQADGYVIKTDAAGVVQWTKTYGGAKDDEFKCVIQTSDGGYALTGYTKSYADPTNGDAWVFKLNAVGDSVFSQSVGGSYEDLFYNVIQLPSGNLLFVGSDKSQTSGQNSEDWRYSIDASNNMVFSVYIAVTHNERYNASVVGLNGTVVIVGYNNYVGDMSDGIIHMYTPSFMYQNWFPFGVDDHEELIAIDKTSDKGFVAIGNCSGHASLLEDIFIVKIDSTGATGTNITSTNELAMTENVNVSLYPNPCKDILTIEKTVRPKSSMLITDVAGNRVFSCDLLEPEHHIDLSALANGFYIVQILESGHVIKSSKICLSN